MTDFERCVVAVIAALGDGEVVSYGDVADDAGFPGRSRSVGAFLAAATVELPWWRIVRADGRLVTDPAADQAGLLRAEGVTVTSGRVVESPAGRFKHPPVIRGPGTTGQARGAT